MNTTQRFLNAKLVGGSIRPGLSTLWNTIQIRWRAIMDKDMRGVIIAIVLIFVIVALSLGSYRFTIKNTATECAEICGYGRVASFSKTEGCKCK
jgi:hypothetical protein